MRKPDFCLGENKGANQLRSYCAFVFATRIVQFLYFLNPKSQGRFVLYLVGNTKDRISRVAAQIAIAHGGSKNSMLPYCNSQCLARHSIIIINQADWEMPFMLVKANKRFQNNIVPLFTAFSKHEILYTISN